MAMPITQVTIGDTTAVLITPADQGGRPDSSDVMVQVLSGSDVWLSNTATFTAGLAPGNACWRVQLGAGISANNLGAGERLYAKCATGGTAVLNVWPMGV